MKKTTILNLLLAVTFAASLASAADIKDAGKPDAGAATSDVRDQTKRDLRKSTHIMQEEGGAADRAQTKTTDDLNAVGGSSKAPGSAEYAKAQVLKQATGKALQTCTDIFTKFGNNTEGALAEIAKESGIIFGHDVSVDDMKRCKDM